MGPACYPSLGWPTLEASCLKPRVCGHCEPAEPGTAHPGTCSSTFLSRAVFTGQPDHQAQAGRECGGSGWHLTVERTMPSQGQDAPPSSCLHCPGRGPCEHSPTQPSSEGRWQWQGPLLRQPRGKAVPCVGRPQLSCRSRESGRDSWEQEAALGPAIPPQATAGLDFNYLLSA